MTFYQVNPLTYVVEESDSIGAKKFSNPGLHIDHSILRHHCVFVRFVPGKYPNFAILRKALSEAEIQDKIDDGWCVYNGKKKKMHYCQLKQSVSDEEREMPEMVDGTHRRYSDPIDFTSSIPSSPLRGKYGTARRRPATEIYDNVGGFIEECAVLGETKHILNTVLYNRYTIWCITTRSIAETPEQCG